MIIEHPLALQFKSVIGRWPDRAARYALSPLLGRRGVESDKADTLEAM